jgi:hypothetical protein
MNVFHDIVGNLKRNTNFALHFKIRRLTGLLYN